MDVGTSARGTGERRRWRLALGAALLGHALLYYAAARSDAGTKPVAQQRVPAPSPQVDIELSSAGTEPGRACPDGG